MQVLGVIVKERSEIEARIQRDVEQREMVLEYMVKPAAKQLQSVLARLTDFPEQVHLDRVRRLIVERHCVVGCAVLSFEPGKPLCRVDSRVPRCCKTYLTEQILHCTRSRPKLRSLVGAGG